MFMQDDQLAHVTNNSAIQTQESQTGKDSLLENKNNLMDQHINP